MTEPTRDSARWGTTSFRPGSDVGLVSRHTVGLIARDNPSTRERLWDLVAVDAPIDDILDELTSSGLKALPDFGVVQSEGTGVRIVARGRVTIEVETADGETRTIDPSDVRTWVEDVISDVMAVTASLPAAEGDIAADDSETFAVLAGSVPARSLARRFDEADRLASAGADWEPAAAEASDMPEADLQMPADADEPDGLDTAASASPPAPSGESWFDDPGAAPGSATPSEPIPPQPAVAGDDDAGAAPSDPAPQADITADPIDPSGALASAVPSGPGTGAAPPSPTPPIDATTILDDAGGPPTQTFTEDHDGMTMSRDQLEARRETEADSVVAVLAFSNGERIDVDRSVLVGRNPKVSGSTSRGLPHIMKFDGPGQGLSRTHAEIRVEGDELVVEDLQSTNGTEVQLPGQPRRRLRANEPVAVVPGSLIDFGDELHCTVESAG